MASAKNFGIRHGRKEEKLEITKSMLKENIDIEIISKVTGFTKEEIEKINEQKLKSTKGLLAIGAFLKRISI